MARRKLTLDFDSVVAGLGRAVDDDGAVRVLDAAADHLRRYGLGRWSMDDVADEAGVGRTSVYRWFGSREELVHTVLARELRMTLAAVAEATAGIEAFEDQVVEASMVCLAALEGSVVGHLIDNDPAAVLPLLTTEAGPLIALARHSIAPHLLAHGLAADQDQADVLAEALARLGLSFVLTRDTVAPVTDPDRFRQALRGLIRPLLAGSAGR